MDPVEAVAALGGVAARSRLLAMTGRRELARSAASGDLRRLTRSDYALPDLDLASRRATELRGKVAVLSAAVAHGWEVARAPDRPWIALQPGSRAPAGRRRDHVIWADVSDESGLVTSQRRTVLDCARRLPFDEALTVADSALRHGVDGEVFCADAYGSTSKGSLQARRVAEHATGRAANVFESLTRACAIRAGLDVEAQGAVELELLADVEHVRVVRPDVVDRRRRLAIEADSWEWHAGREAFDRDCWRYTVLVANGWTVVRFTWWQVRHHPDWVVDVLRHLARRRDERHAA